MTTTYLATEYGHKKSAKLTREGNLYINKSQHSYATAGPITWTGDKWLSGLIKRDPAGAARTDVTPGADDLVAQFGGSAKVGDTFETFIYNTGDATGENITLSGGTRVTLVGETVIPLGAMARILTRFTNVTLNASSEAVDMLMTVSFPFTQFQTNSVATLLTVGTANNTTSAETNLFAGATGSPTLTTLSSLLGFSVPANTLIVGKHAVMKLQGSFTTNGATATITPAIYFNTAAASTKIGTGVASGTFASTAGPHAWTLEVQMFMLSATNIVCVATLFLAGANPATTVHGNASALSGATGVAIVPTSAGNFSASWTGSSANAGNTFQLQTGSLKYLN